MPINRNLSDFLTNSDTPDAPTSVKIVDYDRSSATIAWQPPDRDGGNPIKGEATDPSKS